MLLSVRSRGIGAKMCCRFKYMCCDGLVTVLLAECALEEFTMRVRRYSQVLFQLVP